MKLSDEVINSIAQDLDCGLVCYVHKETGEFKSVVDVDNPYADDIEPWKEDLDEIEANRDQYLLIEKMSSGDAFRVMVRFADSLQDEVMRNRLHDALSKRKPFSHFRYVVDNHEDIRQAWFKFKNARYEDWVRSHLELLWGDSLDSEIL